MFFYVCGCRFLISMKAAMKPIFPPELNVGTTFHRPIFQSDDIPPPGEASEAASSFQEWPVITDIQRVGGGGGGQGGRTSRTRPRTDVRLMMMEVDTPGIAAAPVGGWTPAASVVPLKNRGSIWESPQPETQDLV